MFGNKSEKRESMKKWILKSKKTEETLINGYTGQPLRFQTEQQAKDFVILFGKVVFVDELNYQQNWIATPDIGVLTFVEVCEQIEKVQTLDDIDYINSYLMTNASKFELKHFEFMCEFLDEKVADFKHLHQL